MAAKKRKKKKPYDIVREAHRANGGRRVELIHKMSLEQRIELDQLDGRAARL